MKSVLLYLLLPLLCGTLSMGLHPYRGQWQAPLPSEGEVLLKDARQWLPDVLWVDARDTHLYEINHIPDAISLNHENFERQLPSLLNLWQPGTYVVVYCDTQLCDASHSIAERLRNEIGLQDVWVLYGGWTSWEKSTK